MEKQPEIDHQCDDNNLRLFLKLEQSIDCAIV